MRVCCCPSDEEGKVKQAENQKDAKETGEVSLGWRDYICSGSSERLPGRGYLPGEPGEMNEQKE